MLDNRYFLTGKEERKQKEGKFGRVRRSRRRETIVESRAERVGAKRIETVGRSTGKRADARVNSLDQKS
jgi:hypothetical protein